MKKIPVLIFISCIFYGCSKSDMPGNNLDSFPGALDSIVRYSATDSGVYSNPPATWQKTAYFLYDNQQRVKVIQLSPTYFRTFNYQGNNKLPYFLKDSLIFTGVPVTDVYRFNIRDHYLNYDNLNHLTYDSSIDYSRFRDHPSFPEYVTYNPPPTIIKYKFQANYSTHSHQHVILNQPNDTVFYNASGDVTTMKFQGYQQQVDDYYTIKTPMSDLNIAPLYNIYEFGIFADAVDFLDLIVCQPKFLFKKISGTNSNYYRYAPNDLDQVFFYPQTDASGRITHLVIANYTHRRNSSGAILFTAKFYCNYRFFYHD